MKRVAVSIESPARFLVVADRDFLPAALRILSTAKAKIEILAFAFSTASSSRRPNSALSLANHLSRLKSANPSIEISLFLEGFRETKDKNAFTANRLERSGIDVRLGSTHVKAICVDEKFLLIGSTNLTSQSIDKNFETNLFTDDPKIAKSFAKYFKHYWSGGSHNGCKLRPPLYADSDFVAELINCINSSKSSIHYSIYFFSYPEIEDALIAAHTRGVTITGFFHSHDTFALDYVRATARTAARLKNEGVANLYFAPKTLFSHSKYLIADRRIVFIGTGNWITDDFTTNPQLYLKAVDKILASTLVKNLERKIEAFGRPV